TVEVGPCCVATTPATIAFPSASTPTAQARSDPSAAPLSVYRQSSLPFVPESLTTPKSQEVPGKRPTATTSPAGSGMTAVRPAQLESTMSVRHSAAPESFASFTTALRANRRTCPEASSAIAENPTSPSTCSHCSMPVAPVNFATRAPTIPAPPPAAITSPVASIATDCPLNCLLFPSVACHPRTRAGQTVTTIGAARIAIDPAHLIHLPARCGGMTACRPTPGYTPASCRVKENSTDPCENAASASSPCAT